MKQNIFVIMGIDYHMLRIQALVEDIQSQLGEDLPDIAIANYGLLYPTVRDEHMNWHAWQRGVKIGTKLIPYCKKRSFQYYQIPLQVESNNRPISLRANPYYEACYKDGPNLIGKVDELSALTHISHYFYNQGYENVFFMQNDIGLNGNPIKFFMSAMAGKWSFIAPFHYSKNADELMGGDVDYNKVTSIGGRAAESWCRAGIDFFIFNKLFISALYQTYKNDLSIYEAVYKECYCGDGDLELMDLSKHKPLGFNGIMIPDHWNHSGIRFSVPWYNKMGVLDND